MIEVFAIERQFRLMNGATATLALRALKNKVDANKFAQTISDELRSMLGAGLQVMTPNGPELVPLGTVLAKLGLVNINHAIHQVGLMESLIELDAGPRIVRPGH